MQMKRVRLLPLSCTEERRQSSPCNSAQARLDRAATSFLPDWAAIRAATRRGDQVLVARHCHKAVYHAIELCGLDPVFLLPPVEETFGLGRNALTDIDFLVQFVGTSGEAEVGGGVDAITGVTGTSRAVARVVSSACAYVTGADVSTSATEWGG